MVVVGSVNADLVVLTAHGRHAEDHASVTELLLEEGKRAVLVLCAALPTATNAYILAVRMTGDGRAVATQITAGTVLSMATLPAWMALIH